MKKNWAKIILFFVFALFIVFWTTYSKPPAPLAPTLSYVPNVIMQGDPFMVSVGGVPLAEIKQLTFDGATIPVFLYRNLPTAFVGVNLNKTPAVYKLSLTLSSGQVLTQEIKISARPKVTESLGIPDSLGGNTTVSQNNMVAELVAENKTLSNIKTAGAALWSGRFIPPLKQIFVTDPYGYSRQTGAYSIPHKGVDYRAAVGTPVMAIGGGIVRVVKNYSDYGNTIIIDHGLGLSSFYLHLSEFKVKVGDTVSQGQIIGLSGETGYAEGPHLHLSIRINGVSIDPVKFFALFR